MPCNYSFRHSFYLLYNSQFRLHNFFFKKKWCINGSVTIYGTSLCRVPSKHLHGTLLDLLLRSWTCTNSCTAVCLSALLMLGIFGPAGWKIFTRGAQKRWMHMLDACITTQMSLIYVAKSSKHLRKPALWNETNKPNLEVTII